MAQLIFEIPDDQIELVNDMFALKFWPYPVEITRDVLDADWNPVLEVDTEWVEIEGSVTYETVPNPETKAEFVRKKLAAWAISTVIETKKKEDLRAASEAITAPVISVI